MPRFGINSIFIFFGISSFSIAKTPYENFIKGLKFFLKFYGNDMNREKYEELLNYLNGNILKEWDKRKLRNLSKESEKFEAEFGILLRKKKNGQILRTLKEDEIDSVIFITHNHPTGGHLEKDTVYDKISTRFWWKGMYKDIERYIKTCDSCQRRGNKGGTGYLNPIKVGQPFE